MCDDVEALVAAMRERGVTCSPVRNQGWGLLTQVRPAGRREARHLPAAARAAEGDARRPDDREDGQEAPVAQPDGHGSGGLGAHRLRGHRREAGGRRPPPGRGQRPRRRGPGSRRAGRGVRGAARGEAMARRLARPAARRRGRRRLRCDAGPPPRGAGGGGGRGGEARALREADGPRRGRMRADDRGGPGQRRAAGRCVLSAPLPGGRPSAGADRVGRDRRAGAGRGPGLRALRPRARPSPRVAPAPERGRRRAHGRLRLPPRRGAARPARPGGRGPRLPGQRPLPGARGRGHLSRPPPLSEWGGGRARGDPRGPRAAGHAGPLRDAAARRTRAFSTREPCAS